MSYFAGKRQAVSFVKLFSLAAGMITALVVAQPAAAQTNDFAAKQFVAPTVFQAAGPSAASIQSTVDQFRAALGAVNNANNPGQTSGRREINWDGGSPTNATTTLTGTPLTTFLNTRGANITTRGSGFVQAPPSGLADTFGNSSYATIFHAFSPLRLFSPIGSNVTEVWFSVPGSNGNTPATSTGFGVVFTDVDSPDGSQLRDRTGNRFPSTSDRVLRHSRRVAFHEQCAGVAGRRKPVLHRRCLQRRSCCSSKNHRWRHSAGTE